MPTLFTVGKGENSILSDDLISTPKQLNPLLPESLSNFVMECTRTNPGKRPADMSEVIRRLEVVQHSVNKLAEAHHERTSHNNLDHQKSTGVRASARMSFFDEPHAG